MKQINDNDFLSDEGKVFKHKETNEIMGWGICLGESDTIDNYIEIELPEEYKGEVNYDNKFKKEKAILNRSKKHTLSHNRFSNSASSTLSFLAKAATLVINLERSLSTL